MSAQSASLPSSPWKRLRYHLEALACRAMVWGIPRLSRRRSIRLAQALGTLAYRLDARGRAVALGNLECVFGDRYSPADRRRIAEESYRSFAQTMLDLFWGQRFAGGQTSRWVTLKNYEKLSARMQEEKRGAVFMCAHFGNWEWTNLAGPSIGFNQVSVTERFKNPLLNDIFKRLREHTGVTIIPQENSFLRMLKTVRRGGTTAMLLDLNLQPTQAATIIEAFRNERGSLLMCVPFLHAVLAERGRALLVPFTTQPRPDGGLDVTLHEPVEPAPGATLQQIAQQCWDNIEPFILSKPGDWLWPYKHFRYLPKDAARPYPAYANPSSKFEKLRRELEKQSANR